MKRTIAIALVALLASGCEQTLEDSPFYKFCVGNGSTPKSCMCSLQVMRSGLDNRAFKAFATMEWLDLPTDLDGQRRLRDGADRAAKSCDNPLMDMMSLPR